MTNAEYSVTVIRDFVAQHYLIGGDWGPENDPHSHHYRLELTLTGESLDRHNYMVDIVEIEAALDEFVGMYRDRLLNDMPAFSETNPSIELFCRVAWEAIVPRVAAPTVRRGTVTMWEHDTARASFSAGV